MSNADKRLDRIEDSLTIGTIPKEERWIMTIFGTHEDPEKLIEERKKKLRLKYGEKALEDIELVHFTVRFATNSLP